MAFWLLDLNCVILTTEKKKVQTFYDVQTPYFCMAETQGRILKLQLHKTSFSDLFLMKLLEFESLWSQVLYFIDFFVLSRFVNDQFSLLNYWFLVLRGEWRTRHAFPLERNVPSLSWAAWGGTWLFGFQSWSLSALRDVHGLKGKKKKALT